MATTLTDLTAIAVYCASSPGDDDVFATSAAALGRALARRGIAVVYGGGHVGLMGVLADSALAAGGRVHGVITEALADKELAHRGLTSLRVTATMHDRKLAMAGAADGFIMLPGGYGTFEEFLEVVTWTQLGVHAKGCGVLNVAGFFDPLIELLDKAAAHKFIRAEHRTMVIIEADPDTLLERLAHWAPGTIDKWIDRSDI